MTIIEQIKAEIERQYLEQIGEFATGRLVEDADTLSSLSTLESEKPINQDGLDEEIKRYIDEYYKADSMVLIAHVARHFAQWGAEHLKK